MDLLASENEKRGKEEHGYDDWKRRRETAEETKSFYLTFSPHLLKKETSRTRERKTVKHFILKSIKYDKQSSIATPTVRDTSNHEPGEKD